MTTRSILCTLVALVSLVALAAVAPATDGTPAPTAGTALVAAVPSSPSPAAPAPAPSPVVLATILAMVTVERRDHDGQTPRWALDLDAVCGVDWSNHKGFLSAKEAEAPRLKLVQLLANRAAFYNVEKALSNSVSGWHERWSLPLKALQKLVDRLSRRNSREIEKYEERISALLGIKAAALTAESEREGYVLLDDGAEEDDAGYPLLGTHRWEIDLFRKEFRIY